MKPTALSSSSTPAGSGRGLAGVGLVADPHVPVVVVAALFGPLGQRGGGGSHHSASGTGQSPHHRVGQGGALGSSVSVKVGTSRAQAAAVAPRRRRGRRARRRRVGLTVRGRDRPARRASLASGPSSRAVRPVDADMHTVGPCQRIHKLPSGGGPCPAMVVEVAESGLGRNAVGARTTSTCWAVCGEVTVGGARPVGVAGKGEGLAAFDDPGVGDPPAAPDEAARLVVAAPGERARPG